jgi:hypothetical protein
MTTRDVSAALKNRFWPCIDAFHSSATVGSHGEVEKVEQSQISDVSVPGEHGAT